MWEAGAQGGCSCECGCAQVGGLLGWLATHCMGARHPIFLCKGCSHMADMAWVASFPAKPGHQRAGTALKSLFSFPAQVLKGGFAEWASNERPIEVSE